MVVFTRETVNGHEDEGSRIGAICDDGWEYSDQSAKHPGFFALDGWNGCEPGNLIIDERQNAFQGCNTLTSAAKLVWRWYCDPAKGDKLQSWNDAKNDSPVSKEPLTDAMKLARCLAFIRDEVMHNEEIGMSQRQKGASFLTEIGE